MPVTSKHGNVKKRCDCVRWKECAHPWYVEYKTRVDGEVRRLRRNLDELAGRHAVDFSEAKQEAQRAIVAWEAGRDPVDVQPSDRVTVAGLLAAYRTRTGASPTEAAWAGPIERTPVGGRAFGTYHADEVTRERLEAFRKARPAIAANRDLALLRAAYNWAVLGGVLPATPFKVGTVAAVKLTHEEGRTRRLQPGEQARLLTACEPGTTRIGHPYRGNPALRDLIVAALESGCRKGELLSLQWEQVRDDLFLPGGKTKSKKPRRVPISSTLRMVLDARRLDPAGEALPPAAYVFGDEVGRQRMSIKKAWLLLCARAEIVDLHFHDLRREAGSRWMDAGVPLATIQRWLGHYNIAQTSTYLAASGGGDGDAMHAYEVRIGRAPKTKPGPRLVRGSRK